MTTLLLPRIPATDTNFSSGTASGTPTKADPGNTLGAQGFIPGLPLPGQHLNFVLNAAVTALRQAQLDGLRQRALVLHPVGNTAVTITDGAESIGAVQPNNASGAVIVKTAQAFLLGGDAHLAEVGVPASVTSLMTDAATNGSRIIAIGTGGNRNTYSDDLGSTWSAGGNIGQTPKRIVYNSVLDAWTVTAGTTDVRFSVDDGATWTTAVGAGVDVDAGLAVVSNGNTFSISSINAIRRSTNGGSSWTTVVGAVPETADLDDSGTVAGNTGSVFYHCGRFNGDTLRIASSADGITWTSVAAISTPSGRTYTGRPRLLLCQNSGLMVILAPISGTRMAMYASLDLGVTWTAPVFMLDRGVDAFALCGGRLFFGPDANMYASDGVSTV